jgi:hypothetical protein
MEILPPVIPSKNLANVQYDPNNYHIPFFISNANSAPVVIGQTVNIQYAIDANYIDAETSTWSNIQLNYQGPTIPLVLTIPSNSINEVIAIRYITSNVTPPCFAEEIVYDIAQIKLPPVKLEIVNDTTIFNNAIQPSTTTGQYKFDISYNTVNFDRGPYTLNYTVNGGALQTVTPIYVMPYTLFIPNISGTNTLVMTILDNKGCASTPISRIITLPSAVLAAQATTNIVSVGNSTTLPVYQHKITASGGVGPYHFGTPTGSVIPVGSTGYVFNDNVAIVINQVYDSTGNSVNVIG